MSPYRLLMPVAACLALTAGPVVATEPEETPTENEVFWHVPARDIPLPRAASPVFRENLGRHDVPDKARIMSLVPAGPDQWREAIAVEDAKAAKAVRDAISLHGLTLNAIELDGVSAYHLAPAEPDPAKQELVYLNIHGGAYVLNAGLASLIEALPAAIHLQMEVISIDYRMPPDHPFPAALDDVVRAYQRLLDDYSPEQIIVSGTSAGGGLSMAALQAIRDKGLPLPAALLLGTPWADLSKTGDTLFTNEGIDRVLVTYDGLLEGAARLYADGRDLKHPQLSPLYGTFDDFPPTLLLSGTRDLFLSDTVRTHRALRDADVSADMMIYDGVSHAEYGMYEDSDEARNMIYHVNKFILRHATGAVMP
jgi:monoterpene epsilon-lactone hydrolase